MRSKHSDQRQLLIFGPFGGGLRLESNEPEDCSVSLELAHGDSSSFSEHGRPNTLLFSERSTSCIDAPMGESHGQKRWP